MKAAGLSIRAAVLIGFALILGLWLFAWMELSLRIAEVQDRADVVSARYVNAQEALSNLRAQVLIASVVFRDALLDPDPQHIGASRAQLDATHQAVQELLSRYVPVSDSPAEREQLRRLSEEVSAYRNTMLGLLAYDRTQLTEARDLLRSQTPQRDMVIAVSEGIQTMNRAAYVERQSEMAGLYTSVQRELWQLLGLALAIGVAVAVLAVMYAGRLERSLRLQLLLDFELTHELQELSAQLVTVQEQERRHIARELHDEIGQALTAIKVELACAERSIEGVTGSIGLLKDARSITDGALQQVRDLSYLLHPAALDELGLVPAVDSYVKSYGARHQMVAELVHEGMGVRLPHQVEGAAYRIIQEGLTNVSKHARASRCHVSIARRSGRLRIVVEDDGAGFDPASARTSGRRGLGLVGIRERALSLRGEVSIESAPGQGTRLIIELPVDRAGERTDGVGLAESAAVLD